MVRVRPGYLLALLTLAYLLSMFDRQILILMIAPIKREMGIGDAGFSLLHGFAFSLFYASLGLVFGETVDRVVRTRLLAMAIALWSVATALCGTAQGFAGLFVARMLVGVGEAALAPVAYSLIADLYPRERQARAFSIYISGLYLGAGLAFILGSQMIAVLELLPPTLLPGGFVLPGGWRATFLIAGAPGIVLALLLALAREPRSAGLASAPAMSTRDYLRLMWQRRGAFLAHHGAYTLAVGYGFAKTLWLPTYYHRVHGWSMTRVGLVFGLIVMLCGPVGALIGGRAVEALRWRGYRDAHLRACAVAALVDLAATGVAVMGGATALGLGGAIVSFAAIAFFGGPGAAALQLIVPPGGRGKAGAVFTFVTAILGVSVVPLATAVVAQRWLVGSSSIGTALILVGVAVMLPAAALLWWGRRYFSEAPATP